MILFTSAGHRKLVWCHLFARCHESYCAACFESTGGRFLHL